MRSTPAPVAIPQHNHVRTSGRMRVSAAVAAVLALSVGQFAHAQDSARHEVMIESQPIGAALKSLAAQTGLQVLVFSQDVGDKRSPTVRGSFTNEEALRKILDDSGLTYQKIDDNTVAIRRKGASPASANALHSTRYDGDSPLRVAQTDSPSQSSANASSTQRGNKTDYANDLNQPAVLEEIVVTARKREEKLLDVPAPVSAISADTLARTHAVRLEDYLTAMPGVSFQENRAGQTVVVFRGLTTSDGGATAITYLDNTPLTPASPHSPVGFATPSLDPSELMQIEADRGPQGTLYGANAIGGVLKYVTIKPNTNEFSGRAEVSGDAAQGGGLGGAVRGAVNIPLVSDTLGLRLSAFTRKDPGYIDDPSLGLKNLNSTRTYGFRGALLWNLTDAITLNLSSLVQVIHSHGTDDMDINPNTRQPSFGDLTQERLLRDEFLEARNAVYNAELQWDLGWAKLLSSTSLVKLTNGGDRDISAAEVPALEAALHAVIPNLGIDNPDQIYSRQITEEVRLTSSTQGPLEWQIGAYYNHDLTQNTQGAFTFDSTTQQFFTIPGLGPILQGFNHDNYLERSGFGNIDYHFTQQFDLSVGARYSVDDQVSNNSFGGASFPAPVALYATDHEHAFTWSVNPRYKLSDQEMLYARVATGYRPGGASLLTPDAAAAGAPATFKPDHLTNYELGWKASTADQRATIDLSVYYIRWTDLQESIQIGEFGAEANGGVAFSEGVEAAFAWIPVTGLNLSGSVTYNDNRLEDDGKQPNFSQNGKRLPFTPRFSGQFNTDYKFPVAAGTDGFVGMTVFATMARPNAFAVGFDPTMPGGVGPLNNFGALTLYDPNTHAPVGQTVVTLPGYATLDLRAGIVRGAWTIEGYVKNVTDTRAWGQYGGLNNTTVNFSSQWAATVLPPRTGGISASFKF